MSVGAQIGRSGSHPRAGRQPASIRDCWSGPSSGSLSSGLRFFSFSCRLQWPGRLGNRVRRHCRGCRRQSTNCRSRQAVTLKVHLHRKRRDRRTAASISVRNQPMTTQIIEIQPFHSGWQVRGAEVAVSFPFFTGPRAVEHAIDYACESIVQRGAEIRLLARDGQVISAMAFEKR